jgi:methylmalonyl-CoA/ethylmalonyl-CoA epimerase
MISRIDHISIAVKDGDRALHFFMDLLGAVPGAAASDPVMKYRWQILSLGDLSRLEVIYPIDEGSFLENFLKDKDGGVHHVTLQTPDLQAAIQKLNEHHIPYFGYNEYVGAYWKEIFIHPKDAFGVLIQIAEFNADDWLAESEKLDSGQTWSIEKSESGCKLTIAHPGGGKKSVMLSFEEAKRLSEKINEIISKSGVSSE